MIRKVVFCVLTFMLLSGVWRVSKGVCERFWEAPARESKEMTSAVKSLGIQKSLFETKLKEVQMFSVLSSLPELYQLSSGDVIEISIYDYERSKSDVLIDPNGNISYMLVGQVKAAGKTIPQLRKEMTEGLRVHLRDPLVSIVPVRFSSRSFTILGAINNAGIFDLKGSVTLLDALGLAGGFKVGVFNDSTIEVADLERAFLTRHNEYVPIDFISLVRNGDLSKNINLVPGDYIYIPLSVSNELYLLGEIRSPGSYGFSEKMSLLQVIVAGGGFPETANKENVLVIRGSLTRPEVFQINMEKILRGEALDFEVKPKDIVFVPKRNLLRVENLIEKAISTFVNTASGIEGENTSKRFIGERSGADDVEIIQIP